MLDDCRISCRSSTRTGKENNYTTCTISVTPPSICNTNPKFTFEAIGGDNNTLDSEILNV